MLFLTSLFLVLSQPPFLVPFIPSLFVLSLIRKKTDFLFWFLSGLIFWAVTLNWIPKAVKTGGFPIPLGFLALILLSSILSLISTTPFGLLSEKFKSKNKIPFSISVPIIWTAIEFLRFKIFPWAPFGIQLINTPFSQISEFTGIFGLSFLSLFPASVVLDAIERRKPKLLFIIPLILIPLFFMGILRENQVERVLASQKEKLKVILLRTDFSRQQKWLEFRRTIEREFETTEEAIGKVGGEGSLVVWPETSISALFDLLNTKTLSFVRERMEGIIERYGVGMIVGSIEGEKSGEKGVIYENTRFFNSAFFITEGGIWVQRKEKLVPFGEFIPARSIIKKIGFLERVIRRVKLSVELSSWGRREIFDWRGLKFSAFICWEILFPSYVREAVKEGADFIVNISNDVWFGGEWGVKQHFYYAVARAIENRVYIVRSVNKGIAGIVSPSGKVISTSNKEGYVWGEVGRGQKSFYSV